MASKNSKARPGLLKKMNRSLIIELIFKNKTISRADLAKMTNLALPSVMRLVDGLIDDGIVVDIGKGDSSGGRRPNLVSLNKDLHYIFGVEIAVKTTVVLTDMMGEILAEWSSKEMPESTPEEILMEVLVQIQEMIKQYEIPQEKIGGIGIGTPGTNFKYVRDIDRTILRGWESIDVCTWFKEKLDYPIFVENVARTRTLAELWFGHGKTYDDFIYVFVDQGVGCGIVRKGAIHEGANKVAGEFGHHVIAYKGEPCYCGKEGCIEMYVSAGAILKPFVEDVGGFSDLLNQSGSNVSKALQVAGDVLGVGVANLVNILNPKAIILGGIVPMKSEVVFTKAKATIEESIFSNYAADTEILKGSVEEDGLGSIALVMNQLFKET